MRSVLRFIQDESGATIIEYGFLVSLIGLATVAGMISLGGALQSAYQSFADAIP